MADELFKAILTNGWRQGSVLSRDLVTAAGLPIESEERQYYVVVSHSCDLTNPDSKKERNAEVIRATVTSKRSEIGNFKSAKSPRVLTFEAAGTTETHLITFIEDRKFVPRHLFLEHFPNDEIRIPRNSVNLLALWMARRYRRPELPTEFINRLRPKFADLLRLTKDSGPSFSEVLISLNEWDELPTHLPYMFELKAVLECPDECWTSSEEIEHAYPEEANDWLKEISKLLNHGLEGVKLQAAGVDWEHEVPLTVFKGFKTFDLAYVSFEAGDFEAFRP